MDFIRKQFDRIGQQLSGLTPSQKMLAGALVAIMVMTIAWWTHFAGQTDMQPAFTQVMSAEDLNAISTALQAAGVINRVEGGRVLVGTDDVNKAWAIVSAAGLLPRDARVSFEEMLKNTSPFDSQSKNNQIYNEYRQNRLAAIISGFKGVARANVNFDDTTMRGPRSIEPSASVSIELRRGETAGSQMAQAVADLLSGVVANLKRSRVSVIIDGASFRARDPNDSTGGPMDDYLGQVQKSEAYYQKIFAEQFAFIPGAFFSVRVQPNNTTRNETTETPDAANVVVKPVLDETSNEEIHGAQSAPVEAGAVSNAPITAAGDVARPEGNSTTTETTKTQNKVVIGMHTSKVYSPGGELPVVSAAMHIPRSYFARAWEAQTNTKNPDPKALQPFIDEQVTKYKKDIGVIFKLSAAEAVVVDSFADVMPAAPSAAVSAASSTISLAVADHGKEIFLGALALMSLFMVSNIVRKSAPVPVVAAAALAPDPLTMASEIAVGEAIEGSGTLEGVELNETEVRQHQMQQQVADLVGNNPDAAANLVKRWMNRA